MATNPTLLAMPLAENGTKNVIPATQATAGDGLFSQSTGFPAETSLPLGAGGVAPSREDFNGLANLLGGVAYYAQKGWQFQFDAGQAYFAGCIVRDTTDGKLYECINDVAAGGSVPSADSVNWKAFSTGGVQVGFIAPYAGTGLAEGWLDCDGSAVSRTMYSDLFAVIGTTFGSGDGSTTFNLPDEQYAKAWTGSYGSGDTTPVIYGDAGSGSSALRGKQTVLGNRTAGSGDASLYSGDPAVYPSYPANVGFYTAGTSAGIFADLGSAPSATITPQYSSNIRYMIKYE